MKELLHYDPETGVFRWRVRRGPKKAGSIAGHNEKRDGRTNHAVIRVYGILHQAHRLAWLYVNGSIPVEIDHSRGDGKDNKFENLRVATRTQNNANKKKQSNSENEFKGIGRQKSGRYYARICCDGKRYYLGTFDTQHEAHCEYVKKAIDLFGGFARAA